MHFAAGGGLLSCLPHPYFRIPAALSLCPQRMPPYSLTSHRPSHFPPQRHPEALFPSHFLSLSTADAAPHLPRRSGIFFEKAPVPLTAGVFGTITHPHLVQMPFEITVPDKLIQDSLVDSGYRTGIERTIPAVHLQQCLRQHHIADTDRRCDRLGKSTDVDHFSPIVRGLQGRNRFAAIPEFTVVIIFDQIAVRLFSAQRNSSARRPIVITAPVGY